MEKRKRKRDPQSREVWEQRYRDWKRSGLSQAEYCKRKGIYTDTFYNWSSSFRKAEKIRESGNSDKVIAPFIPVKLSNETLPGEFKIQCAEITLSETTTRTPTDLTSPPVFAKLY